MGSEYVIIKHMRDPLGASLPFVFHSLSKTLIWVILPVGTVCCHACKGTEINHTRSGFDQESRRVPLLDIYGKNRENATALSYLGNAPWCSPQIWPENEVRWCHSETRARMLEILNILLLLGIFEFLWPCSVLPSFWTIASDGFSKCAPCTAKPLVVDSKGLTWQRQILWLKIQYKTGVE